MGKSSGTSETKVTNEMSPEQRRIMQSTMDQYMPDGQIQSRPEYTKEQATDRGNQLVTGFNGDQNAAFQKTRDTAFAHQPAMTDAMTMAKQGAQPTGTHIGLGQGWNTTTGADGRPTSTFEDFSGDAVTRRMNPFQQTVTDQTVADNEQGRLLARRADGLAAGQSGAWGSRAALREATTNASYDQNLARTLAGLNTANYNQAQTQYNTDRTVGMGTIGANNETDAANAARAAAGAGNVANIAGQQQTMDGKGIDALGRVGDTLQAHDQSVQDAGMADLNNQNNYGLQIGQALSGFAPPPSQTSTTSNAAGSGALWGAAGSAALQALPAIMTAMSDERAKTNVKKADPEDALAAIRKLSPVTYDYTDHAKAVGGVPDGRRTGFMAQDLERATGTKSPMIGEYKGVDVADHMGRLTQAVQALDSQMSKMNSRKKAA